MKETCEVLVLGQFCEAKAEYRYPAMNGGYMHLCARHGQKHASISDKRTLGGWSINPINLEHTKRRIYEENHGLSSTPLERNA